MSKSSKIKDQATQGEGFDLDGDTIASRDGDEARAELPKELQPGTQAGRYMILSRLGRGGMGVVYKAYDPELDRRVALKLLSVKAGSGSLADRARERLLREAKALAQLSHPNVVAAYDVGTLGQDVFVAMELVEGWTLKEWIVQKQPTVWEKVAVLQAAGLGIAAAHEAGLIHRDIKPDNIIVGQDGRVRVLDFGLARVAVSEETARAKPIAERNSEPLISGELTSGGSFLDTPMTQAGAIVGTPGYMAPEQYRGEATDEQTDQFSFCVTLYELLYGQRPWRAKKYGALKAKVLAGEMEAPPAAAKVPASYRRIVMRGLALAKQDRYGSMASLLAELGRDPRVARRKKLSLALIVLLVVGAFTGAYALQAKKQQLCQGAKSKLAGVWDQKIKRKVEEKFIATGRSNGQDTYQRVAKALDSYAESWVAMSSDACRATHFRGEQSGELLDLRMNCLDRRLAELSALVALFGHDLDGAVLDKAVTAVLGLRSLAACADKEALAAAYPPPDDPKAKMRVQDLSRQIGSAAALLQTGGYRAGAELAVEIVQAAEQLAYPPAQAEALSLLGYLQSSAGQSQAAVRTFRQAIGQASAARDDLLFAQSVIGLMGVLGCELGRYQEALSLETIASALVDRAGGNADLGAKISNILGIIFKRKGELEQARKHYQIALATLEKAHGPEHLSVATTLNNLGNLLLELEQAPAAARPYQRALAIRQKILGADHPDVAMTMNNMGGMYLRQEQFELAIKHYRFALKKWRQVLGESHPNVGGALGNLGNVYLRQDDYQKAEKYYRQALAIWQGAFGADHPMVAETRKGLNESLKGLGRPTESE